MSPALVDAMAHLDDSRINEPDALLARAAAAGVADIVNAGVDPLVEAALPKVAGVRVWRAIGVHPMACGAALDERLARLEERLDATEVVAIGECGLDRREGMPAAEVQERAFTRQLALSRSRGLPVILHVVGATARALHLLEDAGPLPGGYWHGFTGSSDTARTLVEKHGLHISFGGQVANPKAKKCHASAAAVPVDRLVVESDTPDHYPGPPTPGRLSEPADLVRTLDALAALRRTPAHALAASTAENARRLLGLPVPE